MSKPPWQEYQHEAAQFFLALGMTALVDVSVEGARGKHAIDVLVTARRAGMDQVWVVECKQWKRRVGKDRVLVLGQIVEDIGADRGLLLSESGFQAGAIRSAVTSNITLTSLSDLRANASQERARLDAELELRRIVLLLDRVRHLRPREFHRSTSRTLPGVESGAIIPVVGRLSIARDGLTRATAQLLPVLVDATPDDQGIFASTLEEAVSIACRVSDWADTEILEQEQRVVTWSLRQQGG